MATAAAAAVAKARRDIQHEFFSRDAVRPDRAIPFDPSRHIQRRIFERWQRAGVIREDKPGRFWLDVVAYDVEMRTRYGRLKIVLIVLLLLLGLALLTVALTRERQTQPHLTSSAATDRSAGH
jgi:hypothetical protein